MWVLSDTSSGPRVGGSRALRGKRCGYCGWGMFSNEADAQIYATITTLAGWARDQSGCENWLRSGLET